RTGREVADCGSGGPGFDPRRRCHTLQQITYSSSGPPDLWRRVGRASVDPGGGVSYRMTMSRTEKTIAVLTVRIDAALTRSLAREAKRRRNTKSELAREILAAGLAGEAGALDVEQEARRQS